jgi:translation initiation factor 3 subunit C
MSSRFFARGSDSSDSDSDEQDLYSGGEEEEKDSEQEESDSDEETDPDEEDSDDGTDEVSDGEGAKGASRFLKADDSSEEESEDEKVTVVRSAKDKRIEEAEAVVKSIENAVKINDWHTVSAEFDRLSKMKDGLVKMADGRMPKLFIKILSDLESTSNEAYEKQKTAKVCLFDALFLGSTDGCFRKSMPSIRKVSTPFDRRSERWSRKNLMSKTCRSIALIRTTS